MVLASALLFAFGNLAGAPSVEEIAKVLAEPVLAKDEALQEARDYLERATIARRALSNENVTKENWPKISESLRQRLLDEVVFRGGAKQWQGTPTNVEWFETIEAGGLYTIRKLRFEAVPGFWIPALLYEPTSTSSEKVPCVLSVNGHEATGKSTPYKQVLDINLVQRGMVVLDLEWIGMGQLNGPGYRHGLMNQLDLCGTSGLAVFYLAMSRGLDILLDHPKADTERVAMTGLSGGGWQTIVLSSLDPRITLACPVAGYSSFTTRAKYPKDLGDSEQTPTEMALTADYTDLTALLAPRHALLIYCQKDNCCFEAPTALPPLEEYARPFYEKLGVPERLRTHVNLDPGTHNYLEDNREAFYRMVGDFFYPNDPAYLDEEISCDEDVRSADVLLVPLPDPNADFSSLAKGLAKTLPDQQRILLGILPSQQAIQKQRLARLEHLSRFHEVQFVERLVATRNAGDVEVRYVRLSHPNQPMTLPVIALVPPEAKGTVILIADGGKASTAASVKELLDKGQRVVVADLMLFGERSTLGYLIPLLFNSLGERPLGLQAGELSGLLGWTVHLGDSVQLVADGPRSSVISLTAAALSEKRFAQVEVRNGLKSLKNLIEEGKSVETAPELFCFGLLEVMDIPEIASLIDPPVVGLSGDPDAAK